MAKIDKEIEISSGYRIIVMNEPWGDSVYLIAEDFKSIMQIQYYTGENEVYFGSLFVDESVRKMGRGKHILDEATRICKESGFTSVYLWCYKNAWVRKWYKRLGFKEDNSRDNESMWMSKVIE